MFLVSAEAELGVAFLVEVLKAIMGEASRPQKGTTSYLLNKATHQIHHRLVQTPFSKNSKPFMY